MEELIFKVASSSCVFERMENPSLLIALSFFIMYLITFLLFSWSILTIPFSIYAVIVHDDMTDHILSLTKFPIIKDNIAEDFNISGLILVIIGLVSVILGMFSPLTLPILLVIGLTVGISYLSKYIKKRKIEKSTKPKSNVERYKEKLLTN